MSQTTDISKRLLALEGRVSDLEAVNEGKNAAAELPAAKIEVVPPPADQTPPPSDPNESTETGPGEQENGSKESTETPE